MEVPSADIASFVARARGVPSVIQWGAIGASLSSTSAGKAKTTGLGTALSSKASGPLNVVAPNKA
jgi:hypothetical protein